MKKNLFVIIASLALSSAAFTVAADSVEVNIAPFDVYVNDIVVYSSYAQYPVITYKDVSYIPMTYDLAEKTGLNCGWDMEKGFYVFDGDTRYEFIEDPRPFGGYEYNPFDGNYSAVVPQYDIYINGEKYDNNTAEYPLLNFRDITYFPLTYDIVHNELGWHILWDNENYKLEIDSDKYQNFRPYVVKSENGKTVLREQRAVYSTSINEYGDTRYTLEYNYYNMLVLDHATDTLTQVEDVPTDEYYRTESVAVSITDKITHKDNKFYYGELPLEGLDFELAEQAAISYASHYDMQDTSFISICIYTNTMMPAPYTPFVKYLFMEQNGSYALVEQWKTVYNLENIVPDGLGGYYLYSHSTSWTGASRWSNNFSVIMYVDSNGNVTNLADLYEDYGSLHVLGTYDGNLYVKALYFPEPQASAGNESISAVNDGYFIIEKGTHNLKKLYPYVPGNAFVTHDGGFYLISCTPFEYRIINLLNGKRITL